MPLRNKHLSCNSLIEFYNGNAFFIEERKGCVESVSCRVVEYTELEQEKYGDIILYKQGPTKWISKWQNPNGRNLYDYRITFDLNRRSIKPKIVTRKKPKPVQSANTSIGAWMSAIDSVPDADTPEKIMDLYPRGNYNDEETDR